MADATVELAERYIAVEATNVDGSYSKAALIMQGLLARLSAAEQQRDGSLAVNAALARKHAEALAAAEARAEALSTAIKHVIDASPGTPDSVKAYLSAALAGREETP